MPDNLAVVQFLGSFFLNATHFTIKQSRSLVFVTICSSLFTDTRCPTGLSEAENLFTHYQEQYCFDCRRKKEGEKTKYNY